MCSRGSRVVRYGTAGSCRGRAGWCESLGGVLNTGPDPLSWTTCRLDILALGEHNQLRHKWPAKGSGWHPKGSLEGLGLP